MAITDIFKKEEKKGGEAQKPAKPARSAAGAEAKKPRKASLAARALLHAHVTEKSAAAAEKENRYVFLVARTANKNEVVAAIENYYRVDVVGANMINIPGKRKRRGRGIVVEPGYRKAVVKIKKGQTIEVMPK